MKINFDISHLMKRALPLLALVLAAGSPTSSYAHGTERHFGTPINARPITSQPGDVGSPAFSLLALTANLNGLERDLEQGRTTEVRARARRLPDLAGDLVARSGVLGATERAEITRSAQLIAQSAKRIDAAATQHEAESVLRELKLVRNEVAALEDLLRGEGD